MNLILLWGILMTICVVIGYILNSVGAGAIGLVLVLLGAVIGVVICEIVEG